MGNQITEKISVSALIEGFSNYVQTLRRMLRHPFGFANSIDTEGEDALRNALSFVVYAIALCFFLLIPVFAKHHADLSKVTFLIRYLVQFAMYAFLMHLGLRFIGRASKNFRATVCVYSYVAGVAAPVAMIIQYPILLVFGPSALFGTAEDMMQLAASYQEHPGLRIYATVIAVVLSILTFVVFVTWFSHTHQVTKTRVVLSLIVAGLVGTVIQIFVLNPIFLVAFELIDQWVKYA